MIIDTDSELEIRLRTLQPDGTLLTFGGPEEEAFFMSETRIEDPEDLGKHIIQIQEDPFKVSRYSMCWFGVSTRIVIRTSRSGPPISLHSWVRVREARDRQDACIYVSPRIREEPAGRTRIAEHGMLSWGPASSRGLPR